MYIIGLTGNIATGKSTVARLLAACGAEVIDADALAHETMAPGSAVWQAIREAFGAVVVAGDGSIDRRALGQIVFSDPQALARLEAIVHPAVRCLLLRRLAALRRRQDPPRVVVIEAIKLIEGGLAPLCDALWVVVAPREVQVRRLVRSRHLSPADAALRVDAQPPQEEKQALADVVLVNAGKLADLKRQVREAWASLPKAVQQP
jgi:dephospho-CoA kinase